MTKQSNNLVSIDPFILLDNCPQDGWYSWDDVPMAFSDLYKRVSDGVAVVLPPKAPKMTGGLIARMCDGSYRAEVSWTNKYLPDGYYALNVENQEYLRQAFDENNT